MLFESLDLQFEICNSLFCLLLVGAFGLNLGLQFADFVRGVVLDLVQLLLNIFQAVFVGGCVLRLKVRKPLRAVDLGAEVLLLLCEVVQ